MASLASFADAVIAAAESAAAEAPPGERQSFDTLFSRSVRDAMDRINGGQVDSYDFGPWVISNLILLADIEGYEISETVDFLRELLD